MTRLRALTTALLLALTSLLVKPGQSLCVEPLVYPGIKAIAAQLASEGACVVVADLDAAPAVEAAAELGNADVAVGVAADVTDPAQVKAAVDGALLAFGGIDLVVNNAGLSVSKPLLETSERDWDLQHDVMAKGSFLVSQAAAAAMIDQGLGGDIIYIASKNAVFAGPANIAYSAAKADQAHQVRLLAAELGEHGIRVNGVNPDGVVRGSGIFAGGWGAQRAAVYGVPEDELGAFYAKRTLLKREVLPEHVAHAVAALTSDEALHARLHTYRTVHGAIPGPFEAWLALRGLRTLALRVERAQANAAELAQRLEQHPAVNEVRYPGFGAMISLVLPDAGRADQLTSGTSLWVHATSLGGVESTFERRRRWQSEPRTIPEGLVRLSVGIEDVEDLWEDLVTALDTTVSTP